MKIRTRLALIAGAGLSLLTGQPAMAEPNVVVYGNATYTEESIVLDVFADVNGGQLKSFGVSIQYDNQQLETTSVVRYGGLWYFARADGTHVPYTDPEVSEEKGLIRIVGGHFDGRNPRSGVEGNRLLLATVAFNRLDPGGPVELKIGFASEQPFANFVSVDGETVDAQVEGMKEQIDSQAAPEDTDEDGLPDDFEIEIFGKTSESDGSSSDFDGDGVNDYDEWLGGTDPTDPHSKLTLTISTGPNGDKVIEWTSVEGRTYALQMSNGLGAFENLVEGISGKESATDFLTLFDSAPRAYYRIMMSHPTGGR